jgi:hypothetical protein
MPERKLRPTMPIQRNKAEGERTDPQGLKPLFFLLAWNELPAVGNEYDLNDQDNQDEKTERRRNRLKYLDAIQREAALIGPRGHRPEDSINLK